MNSDTNDVTITYPVERSLVEQAIELLNFQRRQTGGFHKLLIWPGIAFAATLLALTVTAVFYYGSDAASLKTLSATMFGLHMLAGFALAIAFLAGLPQMGFQWWFFRRLRKIGLGEPALVQPSTWSGRLLRILGAIFAVLGVVILVAAGLSIHLSFIPSTIQGSDVPNFFLSVVFLGLGLLLTIPHFFSRSRQSRDLIRHIDELSNRLSRALSKTSTSETVAIRAQDLNLMARMEQARIEAERQDAVARARRKETPDDLVLLNTKNALESIRKLSGKARILVQEQAVALTQAPESSGARWDDESGFWKLAVPDTQLQLNYSIDKERHQVKLISVVDLERGGQSSSSGHAAHQ